jgi:hypothetical protein
MDRRHFLSTSLIAVTAVAGPAKDRQSSKTPAAAAVRSSTIAFSEERFRSLLGSRFQFAGRNWRGTLHLTDVVSRPSDSRIEQFTTVFRVDASVHPAPGLYEVKHPDVGRFALRIEGRGESDLRTASFAILRG